MNVENPGELTQRTFCSPFKGYIIPRMNVDGHFFETSSENDGLDTAFIEVRVGRSSKLEASSESTLQPRGFLL